MELRHLRYFLAVAEELSFTRAASRLGIAQPPLSQQISKLERELGVRLLERNSRSVALTRAGVALLAEARTLLGRAEEVRRIVQHVAAGETGAVRIGCIASGISGMLVSALRAFRQAYPAVLPLVYEMEATPQLDALTHRTIDIGFVRTLRPVEGITLTPLNPEPLVAALPEDHPLAASEHVDLAALANERFVAFPRTAAPDAFDAIVGACTAVGFTPDVAYEAPNDHMLVSLVAAGLGVSLVPRSTTSLHIPGLCYRRLHQHAQAATLAAALPARDAAEPARRLLEVARTAASDLQGQPQLQ